MRSRWLPLVIVLLPLHAVAQGSVRSAAEEYDLGTKAYRNKQYVEAARAFEAAYAHAPNPEALRAAIVARQKSKQTARAATLAALAQKAHDDDDELRKVAVEALKSASKLGSFTAKCAPACSVTVDGQLASVIDATDVTLYLEPGPHKVRVEWGSEGKSFEVNAEPGSEHTETVDKPAAPEPPKVEAPPAVIAPPPRVEPERSRKPLPKVVFFLAAGVTVAAGVGTVISGVMTVNDPGVDAVRRDCVGLGTDCETYQRGQRAELRTNVLLGSTIGLAAVTTALAFFTDFSGASRKSKAQLTPSFDPQRRTGGLVLQGSF